MLILINNELLNTANANDINTDYYFTNSCLIKTGNMLMYGILFFVNYFFETFWEIFVLENYSTDFQKSSFNGNSGHFFVCLRTPLSSFYLTPFSTAFEKVCGGGGFLTQIFELYLFSKTTHPNLRFWVHWIEQVGSSPAYATQIFKHKKLWPLTCVAIFEPLSFVEI